jgi:hypothetical protein
MRREAQRIAKWAAETYPTVKSQNENSPEPDVLAKMLFDDISDESERFQKKISECCQSMQGLCYLFAMDIGALRGFMNFRCLQFTRYMDYELQSRGFEPQSKETKEKILAALDLNIEGWEKITGEL